MRHTARTLPRPNRPPAGVTLIEMMVAMAISILMMAAVAQLIASVGAGVSASRASITLIESHRAACKRLQSDFSVVTATMLPPRSPDFNEGYFEYYEGPRNDWTAYINTSNFNSGSPLYLNNGEAIDTLSGDTDDVLMFTVQNRDGQPFVGKAISNGVIYPIQSQTAEVVWFAYPNGQTVTITANQAGIDNGTIQGPASITVQLYTLYRRVLLVAPEYASLASNLGSGKAFFNLCDLSARPNPNGGMLLNTLGDLTKRENRFAHNIGNFPYPLYLPTTTAGGSVQGLEPLDASSNWSSANPSLNRIGEDVVLTNVLAFDVRAFDPTVTLLPMYTGLPNPGNIAGWDIDAKGNILALLSPSDLGYWNSVSYTSQYSLLAATTGVQLVGYGDFVDLGWSVQNGHSLNASTAWLTSMFSNWPASSVVASLGATYDTWSQSYYQSQGAWSNGDNGFDDNGDGVVDDINERVLYGPPYPTPLRGIQVRIRTYEPDSRQVRELTVTQNFLPQ